MVEEQMISKTTEEIKDIAKNKKFKIGLALKLLSVTIVPMILIVVILTIVAILSLSSGMKAEVMNGLENLAISVLASYDNLDSGDYVLAGDNLMKGYTNITENESLIDSFTEGRDADVTFFFDNTRYATSLVDGNGNRIVGTTCDDAVYEAVVKEGKTYESSDITINGQEYYACYIPLKNSDGTIVGMLFAGEPSTDVWKYIQQRLVAVCASGIVVLAVALILVLLVMRGIVKSIKHAMGAVSTLSSGSMSIQMPKALVNRKDELGDMARGIDLLKNELTDVVRNIKTSSDTVANAGEELNSAASQTNATADEISRAIEDISKGAVTQAEEIENASAQVEQMGNMIENIVDGVSELDRASESMYRASEESRVIIENLKASSDHTIDAIEHIGRQVNATNDSANKISEAIEIITSIAEETNLLSLNASIEAARAGEQGRGFAVVAGQIQKLAEQSNESALRIADIVKELLSDSETTVEVMSEVRVIVDEQQEKLEATRQMFDTISNGIDKSRDETKGIKELTDRCDKARASVVDVITNLSAISEENAASTQETTASMEELNATISILADSANNLDELAGNLKKNMEFFTV